MLVIRPALFPKIYIEIETAERISGLFVWLQ